MVGRLQDTLKELEEGRGEEVTSASRYEAIGGELGAGGLCKVKGAASRHRRQRATDGEKVTVLAQALAKFPLEDVFMSEETRALIENSAVFVRK